MVVVVGVGFRLVMGAERGVGGCWRWLVVVLVVVVAGGGEVW